ncbi:MAG: TonB-dependent receptor [Kordiimonas sp.]
MTLDGKKMTLLGACSVLAFSTVSIAEEATTEATNSANSNIEEIVVTTRQTTFANNGTDQVMLDQQPDASSVLSAVNNLPGIFIAEGGPFGSDDWSTTISIRGFNVGLAEQQVGMTIDGLPNGNSNYGGGSKANRYLDSENLQQAAVSQGTADISSPSHEALGGTINFISNNPYEEQRFWAGLSIGNNNAQRYFFRYDTGEIAEGTTAYFSYSHTTNDAWIGNAGGTTRDHAEFKIVSEQDEWTFTGRASWDDAWENNYQRISLAQFKENPDWDRLTDVVTGVPYIDQVYRPAWGTLRENWFGYVRAEYEDEQFSFDVTPYYHENSGRGDWLPPYVALISGGTVKDETTYGGSLSGGYTFTDSSGSPLAPNAGCTAKLTFPYGGGAPANNPPCLPAGANPGNSYRHAHYGKQRIGVTANGAYDVSENDTVRVGLWWENTDRDESRDWHRVLDPRSGIQFNNTPYWVQYDNTFNTKTLMLYTENTLDVGMLSIRAGAKKYLVDLKLHDNFGNSSDVEYASDSDILFTAGLNFEATEELELFAGFSQNFAAIKDSMVENAATRADLDLSDLEPETADNFDVGLRFNSGNIKATLTGYYIEFNNRITLISNGDSVTGIDYAGEQDNVPFNVGGIESKGIEASLSMDFAENWNFYTSVTVNDSKYKDNTPVSVKDNKVALSPEFQLVGTLSYYNDGIRAGVSAKHVGERYGNFKNTDQLPAHTVVDAWLGYTLDEGTIPGISQIDVSLNVTNLTDKRYLGGGTSGSYFIGAERQATANLTLKF